MDILILLPVAASVIVLLMCSTILTRRKRPLRCSICGERH